MGVVIVSVVRNELDILEAFVRYHAELVDLLVVADHRSIDGSFELLRELQVEGLPLEVRSLTAPALQQGATTALVRDVSQRLGADHVLPLDADEFLTSPELLHALIRSLPVDQPVRLALRNAIPTQGDDPAERNPVARIVHRQATRRKVGGERTKLAVPRMISVQDGWSLVNSNHRLITPAGEDEPVPFWHAELYLAHYPVRSIEQVTWRLISWFATTISKGGKPVPYGPPRRRLSQVASGASLDPEWLTRVALRYHDETPSKEDVLERRALESCPSLRYPNEREVSMLGALADAFGSIDEALAEGRR